LRSVWFIDRTAIPTSLGALQARLDLATAGVTAEVSEHSVSLTRTVNNVRQTIVVPISTVVLEYHG
jgi:hypothetical protein